MKSKWLLSFSIILFVFISCSEKKSTEPKITEHDLVILYTNDEHGWMEVTETSGGAASMMRLWKTRDGYEENSQFLILSGGDMWTGPAISTWFQGESMVDVMNAMHYHAAAIGNHEFDFKINGLEARVAQSDFPFLSANIRTKAEGTIPDFATPYIIKEINGITVGIIGLTTTTTPLSTFPDHVLDYDFIAYEEALDQIVPMVKDEGAELLISIGHICYSEMISLVPKAKELGISVITGGHCNELVAEVDDGIALIQGGSYMKSYAKLEILFDSETDEIITMTPSYHFNDSQEADALVEAVVADWKTQMDAQLSQVIGYAGNEIDRNSTEMYNMVTDSWLVTFPEADVSLTNRGGIRQSIPAGDISLATIVSLLPFENLILELDMTGQELIDGMAYLIFGGMTTIGGYYLADGAPINPSSDYSVLITDYLYARPDYTFQYVDTNPYETSVNYRQPLIDWIESLQTSAANPLENFLDYSPRR